MYNIITKDSYIIEEYGYYRSSGDSYTGIKDQAKRFTLAEVSELYPVGLDIEDFVHIPEDETPYFSRNFQDLLKNQLKNSEHYSNSYLE